MTIKNAIPKFIALLLVSSAVAFIAIGADTSILAKIDSMSATEYIDSQRKLYHHSFIHHYVLWVIIGGFYIASVEFIAYVIGLCFKKKSAD
jgi:hypothetical protein